MSTVLSSTWATGADFSGWDPGINYALVKTAKPPIQFGFSKATEGTVYTSAEYVNQVKGLQSLSDPWGSYHYWHAGAAYPGKAQGLHYLAVSLPSPLGDIIDVEDDEGLPDGSSTAAGVAAAQNLLDCVNTIITARPNAKLGIYTGQWFWSRFQNCLAAQAIAKLCYVWVAEYRPLSDAGPDLPTGWTDWKYWQYTSSAVIPGTPGPCDVNVYHGTLADLNKWIGAQPIPVPTPTPVLTDSQKVALMWAEFVKIYPQG